MTQHDQLDAYAPKINLSLFADITAFIMDTAKATGAQRTAIRQRCPFWPGQPGRAFQEKYGFLYLGELLERYEERFGMTVPDLRAIALAQGYARELLANEMFVGSQWDDFIRRVRESADGDVYLAGALYLLCKDQDGDKGPEASLAETCGSTEGLIFAISLFDDLEYALVRFKPQLVRLLGKERTLKRGHKVYNWPAYQRTFGFISISKTRHIESVSKYITKYITKDLAKTAIGLNNHLYYCSQGLKRSELLYTGQLTKEIEEDYSNEYVKIKTVQSLEEAIQYFVDE